MIDLWVRARFGVFSNRYNSEILRSVLVEVPKDNWRNGHGYDNSKRKSKFFKLGKNLINLFVDFGAMSKFKC